MKNTETVLTLSEKIDRAKSEIGVKQLFIVRKMNELLDSNDSISECTFSLRKKGNGKFTPKQKIALEQVLNIKLWKNIFYGYL